MSSPARRAWALLAAVFLAGAASGAAVTVAVARHALAKVLDRPLDDAREWAIVFRMDRAVGLSEEEERAVRDVLRAHRGELAALRERIQPALREARARQWSEIRAVLREGQRPAFDGLIGEWEERVRRANREGGERTGP